MRKRPSIQALIRRPAFTSTTRYLVQRQAAALQTREQDLILYSSRICYFRPTRPKTYSIFKILLVIATAILLSTIPLQIRVQRQVIIPHLISGALLAERRQMTSQSGSKIGRARPPGAPPTLRSCERRLPHGGSDFALQLSRLMARGISLRRNRAPRFAPD